MPPPTNSKKAQGQARKAEQAEKKKDVERQQKQKEEDLEWSKGTKGKDKAADKAQQAEEAKRKKLERDRLLAEEEASLPSKPAKAAPKAGAKKTTSAPVKSTPKIPDFGSSLSDGPDALSSFSASGIDDALDALSLATSRTDKAYVGSQAAKIETHPERRFKAAFEAYKEEQLPLMKKDYPGLRLQQYNERMHENFKKDPRNPFNQVSLDYNATKEDKVAALQAKKDDIARRLASS